MIPQSNTAVLIEFKTIADLLAKINAYALLHSIKRSEVEVSIRDHLLPGTLRSKGFAVYYGPNDYCVHSYGSSDMPLVKVPQRANAVTLEVVIAEDYNKAGKLVKYTERLYFDPAHTGTYHARLDVNPAVATLAAYS